jgi:hypothetical protein
VIPPFDETAVEYVGFHAYRRKWRTERKHLARSDVAAAGAWEDPRTLDIYEFEDEATVLAVVTEPRKLRENRSTAVAVGARK